MSQAGRTRTPKANADQGQTESSGMHFGVENRTLVLIVVAVIVILIIAVWIWNTRKSTEPKKTTPQFIKTGCQTDAECPTGKHCKGSTGLCVECTGDSHCSGNLNGNRCDVASSSCVACLTSDDCSMGQTCINHVCSPPL